MTLLTIGQIEAYESQPLDSGLQRFSGLLRDTSLHHVPNIVDTNDTGEVHLVPGDDHVRQERRAWTSAIILSRFQYTGLTLGSVRFAYDHFVQV